MKNVSPLWLLIPAIVLSNCSNPADNVHEASVTDADGTSPSSEVPGTTYKVSASSKIEFVGSKVTGSHDGGFKSIDGEFVLVDGTPEGSRGMIAIDTASLWSDNDRLTGHLKSPDFFDVAQYPQAKFAASRIAKSETGYQITGNLDLHGVSKTIQFPADIQHKGDEIRLTAEFFIHRFDFNMKYPGKADNLIRDEVVIKLDVVAKAEG